MIFLVRVGPSGDRLARLAGDPACGDAGGIIGRGERIPRVGR
jgi:hypothetical protein